MRSGSAGLPLRWYSSHPPKWGPSTCQSLRVPSEVRMNAPFLVPTSTRTPAMSAPRCRFPTTLTHGSARSHRSVGRRHLHDLRETDAVPRRIAEPTVDPVGPLLGRLGELDTLGDELVVRLLAVVGREEQRACEAL